MSKAIAQLKKYNIYSIVSQFQDTLVKRLGNKVDSIYLHGSILNGNFVAGKSDVDLVVVVDTPNIHDFIIPITKVHQAFKSDPTLNFEVSYVTPAMIQSRCKYEEKRIYFNTDQLHYCPYGPEWWFEMYDLYTSDSLFYGKNQLLEDNFITSRQLKQAAADLLRAYWLPAIEGTSQPSNTEILYGIESLSRIIYTLKQGKAIDKRTAMGCYAQHCSTHDQMLIQAVIKCQKLEDFEEISQAYTLLKKMIETARHIH